jgi:hypothetical protein
MKKKQDKRPTAPKKLNDNQLEQIRGGRVGWGDGNACACDDWESPVA